MNLRIAVCCWAVSLAAAEAPSPALLILNKTDATLAVVDPGGRKVTGSVRVGQGPHEVVASADGKLAFVSNYGAGDSISVIDLTAMKELRRVEIAPLARPHGLFFAGGKLYFTAEANRMVGRYDPASNKIDWMMGTGQNNTHMVVVTKDGSKVFTANIGSDSIAVFERGQNAQSWDETVIPVGKGPEGMDLSPDGSQLWTATSRDGGVSIIDIAQKKVVAVLDVQTKRSNRLKFTPDGRRVLISDMENGELVVLDTATRKPVKRMKVGRMFEGILVEPDGSRAYLAVNGENAVA
ncbi:MAG TPA: YncE family protein, partial [Bryobacteraceae bacterium]|nr:YncE family protein [Bryobacteraceae bacterium]